MTPMKHFSDAHLIVPTMEKCLSLGLNSQWAHWPQSTTGWRSRIPSNAIWSGQSGQKQNRSGQWRIPSKSQMSLQSCIFGVKRFLEFLSKLHSHIKGLGPKGGMSSPQVHLERQARQSYKTRAIKLCHALAGLVSLSFRAGMISLLLWQKAVKCLHMKHIQKLLWIIQMSEIVKAYLPIPEGKLSWFEDQGDNQCSKNKFNSF